MRAWLSQLREQFNNSHEQDHTDTPTTTHRSPLEALKLAEGEKVLGIHYVHWGILILPILIFSVGFYLWAGAGVIIIWQWIPDTVQIYLEEYVMTSIVDFLQRLKLYPRKWLSYLIMLYAGWRIFKALITLLTTQVINTNKRLIIHHGYGVQQQMEILWSRVDAIYWRSNWWILGTRAGNVVIHTMGGMNSRIPALQYPAKLQRAFLEHQLIQTPQPYL